MPDLTPQLAPKPIHSPIQPPPAGDLSKAEKYLRWLTDLITKDKLHVTHTDLGKFNTPTIQDHFQINLQEYLVEVSHTRNPETDKSSYVMLFTNISNIHQGTSNKVILAYIPLTEQQFTEFTKAADGQGERDKLLQEEQRFKDALNPIDQLLENLTEPEVEAETVASQAISTQDAIEQALSQNQQVPPTQDPNAPANPEQLLSAATPKY